MNWILICACLIIAGEYTTGLQAVVPLGLAAALFLAECFK